MKKRNIIVIATAVFILIIFLVGYLYITTPARQIKRNLSLGEKYLSKLNYHDAILAFEDVLKIDPNIVEAYFGLAEAYEGKGDYDSAISSYKDILNIDPKNKEAGIRLANDYMRIKDYDNAINWYQFVIDTDSTNEEAYIGLANAYIGKDDYDSALSIIEFGISVLGETKGLLELKNTILEKIESMEFTIRKEDFSYELFGRDIFDWDYEELDAYLERSTTKADNYSDGGRTYPDVYVNETYRDGYSVWIRRIYDSRGGTPPYISLRDKEDVIHWFHGFMYLSEFEDNIDFSLGDPLYIEKDMSNVFPTHKYIGMKIDDILSEWNYTLPGRLADDSYTLGMVIQGKDSGIAKSYVEDDLWYSISCNDGSQVDMICDSETGIVKQIKLYF